MFVVTGAGVVVTDPINEDAAHWLQAEMGKITDQPITHLIYSHGHGEHASGGTEYGTVPNVIIHQNALDDIDLVEATIRFSEQMSFNRGDKTCELTYLGPGHGTDLIATVVRLDNVAFVVDAISAKRVYYRDFPGANVDDWINQVKKVGTLDFEIFIGGHGPFGSKADIAPGTAYLEELRAGVLAGLQAGKSVEQIQQSDLLRRYRDWASYDRWRDLNIQGMARHLHQIEAAP